MSEVEKLRALLAEAQGFVRHGAKPHSPHDCIVCGLFDRIDAALAEPVQSEADAFKRGVAAMRKAAVVRCDEMAADFRRRRTRNDEFKGMGAELCAAAIETVKGLPDPEDKP
jgi:hypothetical protein